MKTFFALIASLVLSPVFAAETPIRPIGTYQYHQEMTLTKKRTAETISHILPEGQERIKVLKKAGFTCIRKSQKDSICSKIVTKFDSVPSFIQEAVDKYLKNALFTFPGTGEAIMVHDGAATEWQVREDVMIGNFKVEVFKIVRDNKGEWFITLPVSNEQGIGVLELHSDKEIGLPLTLVRKEEGQTVGYFITAIFLN